MQLVNILASTLAEQNHGSRAGFRHGSHVLQLS